MRRRKSKAKFSKSNESNQDDLPVETGTAEIDVSKSVVGDASENNILCQSEYEGQTVKESENNNNNLALVDYSQVDKDTVDAAEDENIHQEHAAGEVNMGLGEGEEVEVDTGLGEAKDEEERLDDNGDDVSDNDDANNDSDEAEEETDDDIEDNYEFDEDDVEDDDDEEEEEDGDDDSEEEDDDYDNEEEEENDFLMEEEEIYEIKELENNDDALKEADKSQRNGATEGENAKEENEEKGGGSLEKKEKPLMKVKERKKITAEVSDKVASKHNKRQEEDGQDDAIKKADQGNTKEDIQDKEGTSKQKIKKLRKSRKVTAWSSEKVVPKQDDKLESFSSRKVKSMGMIFMCSSKTKKDCYHYKVLGLPANKKELVGQIYKGMRLFLYDVDLKLLYGIYKAAGRGGYNIQPKAFNSQFPSQVRFTVLDDCLPLAEEKFKKVIRDNYFTKKKFDCQLTSQQVRGLCKLFLSTSKGSNAMRSARRERSRASTDKDRSRARREERWPAIPEKRRYHEDSCNHERELLASSVKRRYHEDSRNHERGGLASAVKRRYREDSHDHEREVFASAVAPVPIRLVPAAVATPSYIYDRTLELDRYRHDLLVERRDSRVHLVPEPRLEHPIIYRRDPLLHQLDPYRRDSTTEDLDLRLRDQIGRRDPEHLDLRLRDQIGRRDPEHLDLRLRDQIARRDTEHLDLRLRDQIARRDTEHLDLRLRDEIGRRDPYISYRERLEHQGLSSRDEFARRDPYISYRGSTEDDNLRVQDERRRQDPYVPSERPAYRDHVYVTHQLRETDRYLPANRTDYSSAVAPLPEYRSVRSLYRY